MAIKDYWIYQKRDTPTPWAIYFVKEYDKRKGKSATFLDYTIYSENIETPTHSKSHVGLHFDTIDEYVNAIAAELTAYSVVDSNDYKQLRDSIEDILFY